MTDQQNSNEVQITYDRRQDNIMQNQRLDKLEHQAESTIASIDELKMIMKEQASSMKDLSEAMIKVSATQDFITSLSVETRHNSERLYKEEKHTALILQKLDQLLEVPPRVAALEKQQVKNKTTLAALVAGVSIAATAVANGLFKAASAFFGIG